MTLCRHVLGRLSLENPLYVPEQHWRNSGALQESPMNRCYIFPLQYPFNSSCNIPLLLVVMSLGCNWMLRQTVISTSASRFCHTNTSISAAAQISVLKELDCGPIFAPRQFSYGESCPAQWTCSGAAVGILMPACAWIGLCLRSGPLARFLRRRLLYECAACERLPLQTAFECDGQGLRILCLSKGYSKLPHIGLVMLSCASTYLTSSCWALH